MVLVVVSVHNTSPNETLLQCLLQRFPYDGYANQAFKIQLDMCMSNAEAASLSQSRREQMSRAICSCSNRLPRAESPWQAVMLGSWLPAHPR